VKLTGHKANPSTISEILPVPLAMEEMNLFARRTGIQEAFLREVILWPLASKGSPVEAV